jgi:hypothetical protein
MTTKKLDEATVKVAIEGPVRMRAALAALPAASEAMRDELARWMEMVTPTEGGAPTADVQYGASTDAAMIKTNWRISADAQRIRPGLDAYFADFGAKDDEAAFLDAALEMVGPQRAGIWIEMANDAMDTGWFFAEPFDVTRAFVLAGGGGELGEKTRAWAERHGATRTAYFSRSLGSKKPQHNIFIPVPTFDAAMELWSSLDLPEINGLVDDAMRRGSTHGAGVSVTVNDTGLSRIGVLARRPATDPVLSLIRTRDERDAKLLAIFEGMLAVNGAEWAEYAVYASHETDVELHFTLG